MAFVLVSGWQVPVKVDSGSRELLAQGELSPSWSNRPLRRRQALAVPRRSPRNAWMPARRDSKLASILSDQGINVARRTVAKYRESMSIPSSTERKQLG